MIQMTANNFDVNIECTISGTNFFVNSFSFLRNWIMQTIPWKFRVLRILF